jgi:hypothetical protein
LPEPVAVEEPPPEWAGLQAWADQIHPPFDLEPDECPPPGQKADIPKIQAARRVKKLQKVESRRAAKRRKAKEILG